MNKLEKQKKFIKILNLVRKEVKNYDVPVITMIANNKGKPFKILISTVLSLRTRDKTTLKATNNLFKKIKTPEDILRLGEKKLSKLIYPVGFYNTKSKNIIKICNILINKHNSKVPKSMGELLKLPNVGRKTANIVLTLGFNIIDGIAIDTHCHRIPNRLGIINTKTPEETEKAIMKILPKKYWDKFNDNFVAFGQGKCKPLNPDCNDCVLRKMCEYGKEK